MLERPKKCLMGFFWWQTHAREDVSGMDLWTSIILLSSMFAIAPSRVRMKMEGREETTVAIFDLACFLLLLLHCFRQDDYHLCKGRTQ
jgi:hypothetical protein